MNKSFLPYLIFTDESHVHLNGQVNSKNNILWGDKPLEVAQKFGVASGLKGYLGPISSKKVDEHVHCTVNSQRYLVVLEKFYEDFEMQLPIESMVPAGWCHPSYVDHNNGVAQEILQEWDHLIFS